MGKGDKRRPENTAAIARNWPLGTKWSRRNLSRNRAPVAVRCYFCNRVLPHCEHCGREHCSCTPIGNCRDLRPLNRRRYPKGVDNPYGFEAHRTGFADGPAELDREPNINQKFVEQRRNEGH